MKIALCFLVTLIFLSPFTIYASQNQNQSSVLVTEETFFSFSPNATGYWTFHTTPISGRPILHIENEFGHLLAYGDPIILHMVEGAEYIVQAGFWGMPARYMLNISWSDTFEPVIIIEGPQVENHSMPGEGGQIEAYGEAEITFIPDAGGLWSFRVHSPYEPFPMWIEDPFGNNLAFDNFLSISEEHSSFTIQLAPGVEYTIKTMMPMWIPISYSVTAELTEDFEPWLDLTHLAYEGFYLDFEAARIPLSEGETFVDGETWFSFIPDTTGPWTFSTSNEKGDPLLVLTDSLGSFFIGDDDSGPGLNARLTVYLAEGVEYVLWARFFVDGTGSYTLTVEPFDEGSVEAVIPYDLPGEGGRFELGDEYRHFLFTPEYTGTWAIWLDSNFSYLSISDPSRTFILEAASWEWGRIPFIFIDLAAGVEYNLLAWVSGDSPMYAPALSIIHENRLNVERAAQRVLPQLIPFPL